MGLDLKKWVVEKLGGEMKGTLIDVSSEEFFLLASDYYIRELAFWSCVNRFANAISKCEFKTFYNHQEVKKAEYYLWNIEPNKNQNSNAFIQKLISKLFLDNEVLIVESNGQLMVADSFSKIPFAMFDDQFKDVQVGEFKYSKTFYQADVMYLELNSKDMRRLVNGMYESYSKMLAYAMKSYQKSRGNRGILNVSAMAQASEGFQETFEKLMNERFKNFLNADNAVLPLFEGYSYNDIGSKTYSNEGTRDIKAMVDDIFDMTARAFCMPPSLAKGDVQDTQKAIDELLTFGVDPLADKIQTEANRKRNGMSGFLAGNYMKIDTSTIKHIDIFEIATPIDKLISSGAFCVNDILKALGREEIQEDWARQHFITKNYSNIEDVLKGLGIEGGEN